LHISSVATIKKTKANIHVLSDIPDNRILECALAGEADFIVTGDKPMLALKRFNATHIISLANFLSKFKNE